MDRTQIRERRKQLKDAFRDRAYEIDKRMGVKRVFTHPFAFRMNLEVDNGFYDDLSPEEFERELDNFEFDYAYELYPEEFQRLNQEQIDAAEARKSQIRKNREALIEAGGSPKQETLPPVEDLVRTPKENLEDLVRKTKENPSASVPINVSQELKVGGRTRIF